ncbi:MAG: pyridoxamine 5'-phosphate oxidase family protein [Clostridia bacterium]|nr:pyridoxamine 5'-phosphate oxidase family protein [Clostridia bacterium]
MPTKDIPFEECVELLKQADYGSLAMSMYGQPYVVLMSYVYDDNEKIYLHSGLEGRKIDYMTMNPSICFNVTGVEKKVKGKKPCSYGYRYWSVNVFGYAGFVEEKDRKKTLLHMFSEKFCQGEVEPIPDEAVDKVKIIAIDFKEVLGKRNYDPDE